MSNRIRRVLESIVFAGLRPGPRPEAAKAPTALNRVRRWFDRFVSGGRPPDPLYLSNRTWGQRLRLAAVVAVPCLIVAGTIGFFLSGLFRPKTSPPKEMAPAELLDKMLPDLNKNLKIDANHDAEVTSIRVMRDGSPHVAGTVRNKTARAISVELIVYYANSASSHIGSDTLRVDKVPAGGSADFSFPLKVPDAVYALVREIRTLE